MKHRIVPPARPAPGGPDRNPDRRDLLRTAGGLALLGLGGGLAGCAAPQPEESPIDPGELVYPPPPETPRFYYERTLFGSGSVEEETEEDRLRRFATGETARGEGFAKPFDVLAHEGRVFVSDTVSRTVHALDFPRKRYYRVGERGVSRMAKPLGLDVDGRGRLYIVDGPASRVVITDLEGNYVGAVGREEDLNRPTGIAVSQDGERIHVLDTGGVSSAMHRVVVYDPDGRIVRTIGRRGAAPGQFNLPLDCTLDSQGRLYVLDTGNFRCQIFSPDGEFEWMFGEAGRFPGQFGHPKGIAVDGEGKIYISDTSFGVFQLFNSEGQILMSVGKRREQAGPGHFILPAGISVDVDQRIYMVDQFYRKVDMFRPAGVPESTPVGQPVAFS